MLDYDLLEALLAVEQEGSFEGASRSLRISSSAVSQRIRTLEERIGAITVKRQTPAMPTEFGHKLCRHAEKVMALEEELIKENQESFLAMEQGTKVIKLVVNDDSLSSWFIEVLKTEAIRDQRLRFHLSIADQDHSIELMKSGAVLAAISIHKTPAAGFRSTFLGTHVYRATASPEFLNRFFPDGVTKEAMEAAPALRYSALDNLQKQWLRQVFDEDLEPSSHVIPSSYGFVDACLNHVGWAMNPSGMVEEHIKNRKLVEVVPGQVLKKPLYWHYSRAIEPSLRATTKSVVQAAVKQLQPNAQKMELSA